jgi:mono/diheme cytochrome c family protein
MKKTAIVMGALLLAGSALAQEKAAPAGDVQRGEKHFMSDGCYQCHGIGGNGAILTGPRLARTELDFESFRNQLRHPASEMPPYEAPVVSEQTVADLYAFVKSRPAAADAKSLPLLMGEGVK